MRRTWPRRAAAALAGVLLLFAAGCAGSAPAFSPARPGSPTAGSPPPGEVSPPRSPAAPAPVVIPADGVSLRAFGLTRGPADRVFLPHNAFVSARVDQANNVAVVLPYPSAAVLTGFLRQSLPANGFVLTATNEAGSTLTFAGFGWTGTFTGSDDASALLLRPAG